MKDELKQLEKEFCEWSGFKLEGQTKQEKLDFINSTKYSLECELDIKKNEFVNRINSLLPNPACPECLMEVSQEELNVFGGLCEECSNP